MSDDGDETVLIVDDEEQLAESYALLLNDHYETDFATSGGEALSKLGPDIDVVLLDRRMPGMAGDDVIERISEWDLDFQVVIVSAIDPDTDIIGLPIDGYLTKSVSKEELLDAVDRALLKDRYEQLISEYNAVAETYDVLSEEYSQSELETKDEFEDLEDRMESLQADIDAVVDDLGESSITNIFD